MTVKASMSVVTWVGYVLWLATLGVLIWALTRPVSAPEPPQPMLAREEQPPPPPASSAVPVVPPGPLMYATTRWGSDHGPVRVLWLQPVFLPVTGYLEANGKVLEGLESYQRRFVGQHGRVEVDVYFAGWALTDALWEEYMEAWRARRSTAYPLKWVEPRRQEHNWGSAFLFHELLSSLPEWATTYRYVVINNCDVYLPLACPPIVWHAVAAAECVYGELGLVAYNLEGDNCHTHRLGWTPVVVDADLEPEASNPHPTTVVLAEAPASGGLAMATTVWSSKALASIGGFECRGVYSSDDGRPLALATAAGKRSFLLTHLKVFHPAALSYTHPDFLAWKMRSLAWSNLPERLPHEPREHLLPWALESEAIFRRWEEGVNH